MATRPLSDRHVVSTILPHERARARYHCVSRRSDCPLNAPRRRALSWRGGGGERSALTNRARAYKFAGGTLILSQTTDCPGRGRRAVRPSSSLAFRVMTRVSPSLSLGSIRLYLF